MGVELTEERAKAFFSEFYGGEHHLPRGGIKKGGWACYSVKHHQADMATFDYDELTRLVLLAHDWCMRVSVSAGRTGGHDVLTIRIWQREREGGIAKRHPTIEQVLEGWRERRPLPEGVPCERCHHWKVTHESTTGQCVGRVQSGGGECDRCDCTEFVPPPAYALCKCCGKLWQDCPCPRMERAAIDAAVAAERVRFGKVLTQVLVSTGMHQDLAEKMAAEVVSKGEA